MTRYLVEINEYNRVDGKQTLVSYWEYDLDAEWDLTPTRTPLHEDLLTLGVF